ncbi:glycosyltransferase family 2 protein [Pseudohalocynthiibacter sp. F2068]|uniref:glycosyltransferase family 2 protein n=1 Tax=Pseudohalocynthiibacter sp. F2068 TaxID=2926418 RepID=UPI001FF49EFD|nr:glycosyltransferase family 2 protein [Pseudohalocynthiibacter sp. F2068]
MAANSKTQPVNGQMDTMSHNVGTLENSKKAVDITAVIVNYNTREVTENAITSVLRCTGGLEVEIIVVDNASSDGSVQAFRAEFPQVKVIDTGYNGGYAWGNNVGIHKARGRYVLILNPDALIHETTLKRAVDYMNAHPEVGILGASVSLEDGSRQLTIFRFPSLSNLFWHIFVPNRVIRKSRHFGDQRYASQPYDQAIDVDVVAGCFMMLPRKVIDQVGLMDDRFFMYSEETEWCLRVKQAGYSVRYNPDVQITHYGAVSTGQSSPWKSVEITRSQILFLRISRGPASAMAATVLMLLGELFRGVWLLPSLLRSSKTQKAALWSAKTGFLIKALFNQPKGQKPPPAELAGR